MTLSHAELVTLAPRMGKHDVPCPLCGPDRSTAATRAAKKLRIWHLDPRFIGFHCARCGAKGGASEGGDGSRIPNSPVVARVRAEMADRERDEAAARIAKALGLWRMRRPIGGTIAERYLRNARFYRGPLPATLGFLPGSGDFPPAMIAAFGLASEPEPGVLAIGDDAVKAVHLTRLAPDGSAKAGTDRDKFMLGRPSGSPIVVAPMNDLLGLAIAEGIEDALSLHAATGLGAWAAGSASHLPGLAEAVPGYVGAVSIVMDGDTAGRDGSAELRRRLVARGLAPERLALTRLEYGEAA